MWPVGKLRHREVESCVRGCTAARWLGCATNPGWLTMKPAFKVKSLNQQQQGKFVRNAHYYPCNILMPTEVRTTEGTSASALPADRQLLCASIFRETEDPRGWGCVCICDSLSWSCSAATTSGEGRMYPGGKYHMKSSARAGGDWSEPRATDFTS